MVRNRNPVWSLWISWACRRGFLSSDAHAARLRKSQRNLLSSRHNLQAAAEIPTESRGTRNEAKAGVSQTADFCSVSGTSSQYHQLHWLKRIFGSRLAMSMSSRKMLVNLPSFKILRLTPVLVRQCETGIQAGAWPWSKSCKGPTATWLAASPTEQQFQQSGASNWVPWKVGRLR